MLMMMTTMRVSLTSLLLILGIFCSSTWAFFESQSASVQRRTACGAGMAECGPGAHRQCIPEGWLCDGDNDCGDNSDEQSATCASAGCPSGEVNCQGPSPSRRCIRESWVCDGDNDCGNGWDEQTCAPPTCQHGYLPCPSGSRRQCISEHWLCDGDNDCGDNSDEDPQNCQSNGASQARTCQRALEPCGLVVAMGYMGMRPEEILETVRNTDLRETCGPVLDAEACVITTLHTQACQFTHVDHPRVIEMQKMLLAANTTVNFVCREHVDVFNEHKGCLLRAGHRVPAVMEAVERQCRHLAGPSRGPCPPPQLVTCAQNVVRQECGEEITGYLTTLGSRVLNNMGCTGRKRTKMTKKEMHSPLELMEMIHSLF